MFLWLDEPDFVHDGDLVVIPKPLIFIEEFRPNGNSPGVIS